MPLKVVCFCAYPSGKPTGWSGRDFDAYKFIHALKGDRPIRGYAHIPVCGKSRRLNSSNVGDAVEWFGEMAADYLDGKTLPASYTLMPVPNSQCSVRSSRIPSTLVLAKAISRNVEATVQVRDYLRFKVSMPSSHQQGGTRDPAKLYNNLTLTRNVSGQTVILVDDVLTSGGHLRAASALLCEKGADVVLAICAGRTMREERRRVFGVITEELDDL